MEYSGPDRRKHKVVVTRNTEYHLCDNRCVAVRETGSGQWQMDHQAVGARVLGCLAQGVTRNPIPRAGDRVFFEGDLLTSPVERVRRPSRDTVTEYAAA